MGGVDENGWYSKNGALVQRSKETRDCQREREVLKTLKEALGMAQLVVDSRSIYHHISFLHLFAFAPGRWARGPAAFQPGIVRWSTFCLATTQVVLTKHRRHQQLNKPSWTMCRPKRFARGAQFLIQLYTPGGI